MSKWIKKGKYYAVNGSYTMSWNDVNRFLLCYGNNFVESGTREKCLDAFNSHKPIQNMTADEWLVDYNKLEK